MMTHQAEAHYNTAVIPGACSHARIRPEDLGAFGQDCLRNLKSCSHVAQLRLGPRTVGLRTLMVYPQYEEVHVTFGEIAKDMRGQNLNRKLLAGVFDFSARLAGQLGEHVYITVGGFTPDGESRSLPLLREMSVDYKRKGVTFDYRP